MLGIIVGYTILGCGAYAAIGDRPFTALLCIVAGTTIAIMGGAT